MSKKKRSKIPIQVRAGQIQFYFDGPLPVLKEGIIGDLVLRGARSDSIRAKQENAPPA